MGFESFRVALSGEKTTYQEADLAIRRIPHVGYDQDCGLMEGSSFYLLDDGRHKIEMELMDEPVYLSCRFTLCHPPSVDSAFLDLIRELMATLKMDLTICEDADPQRQHPFPLERFAEASAIILDCIAARRAEWIMMCGTEHLAATTKEAFQQIIIPRCVPGSLPPVVAARA